jgi:hypothetical protein
VIQCSQQPIPPPPAVMEVVKTPVTPVAVAPPPLGWRDQLKTIDQDCSVFYPNDYPQVVPGKGLELGFSIKCREVAASAVLFDMSTSRWSGMASSDLSIQWLGPDDTLLTQAPFSDLLIRCGPQITTVSVPLVGSIDATATQATTIVIVHRGDVARRRPNGALETGTRRVWQASLTK